MSKRKTVTFATSALHRASSENNLSQLKEIIVERREDVNQRDMFGFTPLMDAALNNNSDSILFLVHRGADIDMVDNGGLTALAHAAEHGHVNAVASLVSCGADLNRMGREVGQTPLMRATQFHQIYCVKILIDQGADIEAINGAGKTALFYACEQGDSLTVDYLLQNGANPNHPGHTEESSPLLVACKKGYISICLQLLKHGADPNASNGAGMSCLHYAVRVGNAGLVERLLEMGANPLASDGERRTVFHAAAGLGQAACLVVLLRKVPFVDSEDDSGKTALVHACEGRSPACVEHLLNSGSDVNHASSVIQRYTPLMFAVVANDPEIVNILLHHGADHTLCNSNDLQAAHLTSNRRILYLLNGEAPHLPFGRLFASVSNGVSQVFSLLLFVLQLVQSFLKSGRTLWVSAVVLLAILTYVRLVYSDLPWSHLLGHGYDPTNDSNVSAAAMSSPSSPSSFLIDVLRLATFSSSSSSSSSK